MQFLQSRDTPNAAEAEGQADFEMANLHPRRTGLPFIVFISQKAGAQHDIRVKVSRGAKVQASDMGTYALRPFRHEAGLQLSGSDAKLLGRWVELNLAVLTAYWDGEIEYTEDVMEQLQPIRP